MAGDKRAALQRLGTGLGLLIVAAFFGWVLLTVPPRLAETLDRVRTWGDGWFYAYVALLSTGGILFGGATLWILIRLSWQSLRKRRRRQLRDRNPSELSLSQQADEVRENLATVEELAQDQRLVEKARQQARAGAEVIQQKQAQRRLEIVAFGTISSGKSSLLNLLAGRPAFRTDLRGGTTTQRNEVHWPSRDRVVLVDTPGLAEIEGQEHVALAAQAARDADLVLVVLDGPLRDHEYQLLERLAAMEKKCLVCLNKSDWFSASDQAKLVTQIETQLRPLRAAYPVICVRAEPGVRTRIREVAGGTTQEETVEVPPDISELSRWMLRTIDHEGDRLLLSNLLLRSRGLVEQTRREVERSIDQEAWRIVDRYMWGAGGAAALSPLPIIDLLAGCTLSSKMVVDLARVYRQDVDLELATQLLGQLAKNLVGILGTSLAVPAVATAAGQLFKTVPGIGTLTGGVIQGAVQAVITRWIGAVFIEYFRHEMHRPEGGLAGLARRQWDQVTTASELKRVVEEGRRRWGRKDSGE